MGPCQLGGPALAEVLQAVTGDDHRQGSSSAEDGDGHHLHQAFLDLTRGLLTVCVAGISDPETSEVQQCVNGPSKRLPWRSYLGWACPLSGPSSTFMASDEVPVSFAGARYHGRAGPGPSTCQEPWRMVVSRRSPWPCWRWSSSASSPRSRTTPRRGRRSSRCRRGLGHPQT
jgi:hypothetical protein